jgi:hypothetical protein
MKKQNRNLPTDNLERGTHCWNRLVGIVILIVLVVALGLFLSRLGLGLGLLQRDVGLGRRGHTTAGTRGLRAATSLSKENIEKKNAGKRKSSREIIRNATE